MRSLGRRTWYRELLLIAVVYAGYEATRGLEGSSPGRAIANGRAVLSLEHGWHIAPEVALNGMLAHITVLAVVAAYFYSTLHYLVTPAVLIWLYRARPEAYGLARTSLMISTLLGLVGFWLLPTAPPRLLPGDGVRDTLEAVSDWGWWSGEGSVPRGLGGLANQLAAVPSLHVGWALWCGVLLVRHATRRWVRWLGALYPLATTVVVVSTGNHYLLDAVAGAVTMGIGLVLARSAIAAARSLRTSALRSVPAPAAQAPKSAQPAPAPVVQHRVVRPQRPAPSGPSRAPVRCARGPMPNPKVRGPERCAP
jgi:hypothetical protein